MKRKIFAVLTVLILVLSFGSVAFADDGWANYYWSTAFRTIKQGNGGGDVRGCQEYMYLASPTSPGTVDGVFGTNTKNAVMAYQNAYGLTGDGIVGPMTWSNMQSHIGSYQEEATFYTYSIAIPPISPRDNSTELIWQDRFQHNSSGKWSVYYGNDFVTWNGPVLMN